MNNYSNVVPFRDNDDNNSLSISSEQLALCEALVFMSEKPLDIESIAKAMDLTKEKSVQVTEALRKRMNINKERGITLSQINDNQVHLKVKEEYMEKCQHINERNKKQLISLVAEFLHVKQVKGLAEGTLYGYRLLLERFAEKVAKSIDNIKPHDIRMFLMSEEKERGNSRNTISRKTTVLSSFFEWLERDEIIQKNPMKKIDTPQTDEKKPKFLTHEEIELVREVIESLIDEVIFETLYSSGIRASEAVKLNWDDLDFNEKTLHVRSGKGGKSRTTLLSTKAIMVLKKYRAQRKDNENHVFRSRYKKRMSRSSIYRHIKELAKKAGIEDKMSPHSLRHSFGTHLLRSGVPIDMVQMLLGHSDVSTTQIYSITDQAGIDQHYRKVFP